MRGESYKGIAMLGGGTQRETWMLSEKVISIVAETRRIPMETVTLDSSFEELNIDSLDAVEIVFALEEAFKVNIPNDVLSEIRTVRDVVERLEASLTEEEASLAKEEAHPVATPQGDA
jgi:acyl carrier protein